MPPELDRLGGLVRLAIGANAVLCHDGSESLCRVEESWLKAASELFYRGLYLQYKQVPAPNERDRKPHFSVEPRKNTVEAAKHRGASAAHEFAPRLCSRGSLASGVAVTYEDILYL